MSGTDLVLAPPPYPHAAARPIAPGRADGRWVLHCSRPRAARMPTRLCPSPGSPPRHCPRWAPGGIQGRFIAVPGGGAVAPAPELQGQSARWLNWHMYEYALAHLHTTSPLGSAFQAAAPPPAKDTFAWGFSCSTAARGQRAAVPGGEAGAGARPGWLGARRRLILGSQAPRQWLAPGPGLCRSGWCLWSPVASRLPWIPRAPCTARVAASPATSPWRCLTWASPGALAPCSLAGARGCSDESPVVRPAARSLCCPRRAGEQHTAQHRPCGPGARAPSLLGARARLGWGLPGAAHWGWGAVQLPPTWEAAARGKAPGLCHSWDGRGPVGGSPMPTCTAPRPWGGSGNPPSLEPRAALPARWGRGCSVLGPSYALRKWPGEVCTSQ